MPYWEHLLLHHDLDVMHIKKNICDNIIGTLFNQDGKMKDNYKTGVDLEEMGIISVIHPQLYSNSDTIFLPRACYQVTGLIYLFFLAIKLGN